MNAPLAAITAWSLMALSPEEPTPFAWRASYDEGLDAALAAGAPLLVYFPAVRDADEPPVVALAPQGLRALPRIEGVRVGADEILVLKERFRVKALPALLLLDRRENVVGRWEGTMPSALWPAVGKLARRIRLKDGEDAKALLQGQELLAAGALEGARRKVAPLLSSPTAAPEVVAAARAVESKLIEAFRGQILRLLAREALVPDADLDGALKALRASTQHPLLVRAVDLELERLRSTSPGGGSRPAGR